MKTQLASPPARQDHPPQPTSTPLTTGDVRPARRVGVLDRAALRIGIALITWGRRPASPPRRTRRTRRVVSDEPDEVGRQEAEAARRDLEELRDQFFGLSLFR